MNTNVEERRNANSPTACEFLDVPLRKALLHVGNMVHTVASTVVQAFNGTLNSRIKYQCERNCQMPPLQVAPCVFDRGSFRNRAWNIHFAMGGESEPSTQDLIFY